MGCCGTTNVYHTVLQELTSPANTLEQVDDNPNQCRFTNTQTNTSYLCTATFSKYLHRPTQRVVQEGLNQALHAKLGRAIKNWFVFPKEQRIGRILTRFGGHEEIIKIKDKQQKTSHEMTDGEANTLLRKARQQQSWKRFSVIASQERPITPSAPASQSKPEEVASTPIKVQAEVEPQSEDSVPFDSALLEGNLADFENRPEFAEVLKTKRTNEGGDIRIDTDEYIYIYSKDDGGLIIKTEK